VAAKSQSSGGIREMEGSAVQSRVWRERKIGEYNSKSSFLGRKLCGGIPTVNRWSQGSIPGPIRHFVLWGRSSIGRALDGVE
jgi:hypothetical protein